MKTRASSISPDREAAWPLSSGSSATATHNNLGSQRRYLERMATTKVLAERGQGNSAPPREL
jgi:hypothetical protein